VECPNCGQQNASDANFCAHCGTALSITCPVCSTVAPAGTKFCSNCGANLQTAEPAEAAESDLARYLPGELLAKMRSARAGHAMQGERRTVTMLFADIKGSTAAAEQMDPEDWATIVNGAFEHLIAPVYRYEGTLAHLQGDAVLAFFGAPIAHEDDPVRAARAGLEIVEAMKAYSAGVEAEWGILVEVRVGINTGLVVVGEVGSDLRVEYTALGDAINVAARMEQTADPGTVRVTARTLSLTGGVFEVEDLGDVEVKGKSEPVTAHRVIRFVGGKTQARERRIVGRETELELFDDLRARLMGGSGWIASIIAEAGLGKSRLVDEVRRRTGGAQMLVSRFDETGDASWMFGASRSYDSAKPFSTIRDLLRRWWDVDAADDEFGRVEAASADSGAEDPDTAAFLAYIGGITPSDSASAFLDALETSALHARASDALSSYLEAVANQRPLYVVIEDLHWADDLSLAIVEGIMDLTERVPIGLIVALRPYREETSWRVHEVAGRDHHHRYHHLDLPPLPTEDSTALIDALLDESGVSDDTKRRILDRSDGNPLFIEEMVRSIDQVKESGELALPTSLTAMLTARLDRLDEESRFVVQMASVLGTEFDRAMLVGILEDPLDANRIPDLLRQGIFVEAPHATDSLGFRHALIQEAAYETILRKTRRELHRRVADHLISTSPDAVQDIAFHLVEANQADVAFPYLIEAGMLASRSMSLADAIRLLTTAMDTAPVDADPVLIERAHEALGEAYALVPDLSLASAAYQRLYEFGEESSRPSARVMALNHLGYATASLGADLVGANLYLDQARSLAEEIGDELGLAQYHMNACFVASLGGRVAEAAAHDEATVELGEKAGVDSIRLAGLVRRAVNYCFLLDLEKGASAVETALEAAEGEGLEEARAIVNCFGSSVLAQARGDLQEAVEVANREHATLERYSSFYLPMSLAKTGGLLFELGDLEGALAQFVSGRRTADKFGQPFVGGAAASGMAVVYAAAGVSESIPELRDEAERTLAGAMGEFFASTTWANLGFTDLLSGNIEEADTAFSKGLAASSISQFVERPRLLGGKALALLMSDDLEAAGSLLDQAWEFVSEKGFIPFNPLLHLAQGELAMRRHRPDEAEESLILAQQAAMESGQRLMTMRILEARARLAVGSDSGTAVHHLDMARSAVDAMAMSMADEMLRERFVATQLQTLDLIAG